MTDAPTPSGFHDELAGIRYFDSSGWHLELGTLPDGRFAVDHYSMADERKQRTYHETEAEALEEVELFIPTRPKLTSIGDVAVAERDTENPYRYRGPFHIGPERRQALRDLRDGVERPELSYWHAPVSGGARKLASKDEVDWRGMGE